MSVPPTTASHVAVDPAPVKAKAAELTAGTGSEVLGPEDPALALVAGPTVVELATEAVVVEPGLVDVAPGSAVAAVVLVVGALLELGAPVVVGASPADAGLVVIGSVAGTGGVIVVGVGDAVAGHPGGVPVMPAAV